MKYFHFFCLGFLVLFYSCKKEHQDYAILSGKIINPHAEVLEISKSGDYKKVDLGSEGIFRDTIRPVKEGLYNLTHGDVFINFYVKNGFTSEVVIDLSNEKDPIFTFKGDGAQLNDYAIANDARMRRMSLDSTLFRSEENVFNDRLEEFLGDEMALVQKLHDADSTYVSLQQSILENHISSWRKKYETFNAPLRMNGKPAPAFTYVNHAGGETSLSDFKGKYVYIDLWATWCGPCIELLPYLEKAQEKYKDRNIQFLSISVDKLADGEKWRNFVTDKQLKGIQLWTKGDSTLTDAYKVDGIPKFILIDPEGNTLRTNAPFPVVDDEDYLEFDNLMKTLAL